MVDVVAVDGRFGLVVCYNGEELGLALDLSAPQFKDLSFDELCGVCLVSVRKTYERKGLL